MADASSYAGYAQAGASTMGTIMDAINNTKNREYNDHLQQLAQAMAERERQDKLNQQDFENKLASSTFGLTNQQAQQNMSQQRESLAMTKRKLLIDSLRNNLNANPSTVTGSRSLFAPLGGQ